MSLYTLFLSASILSALFVYVRRWWCVYLLSLLVQSACLLVGARAVINRNKSSQIPSALQQQQNDLTDCPLGLLCQLHSFTLTRENCLATVFWACNENKLAYISHLPVFFCFFIYFFSFSLNVFWHRKWLASFFFFYSSFIHKITPQQVTLGLGICVFSHVRWMYKPLYYWATNKESS